MIIPIFIPVDNSDKKPDRKKALTYLLTFLVIFGVFGVLMFFDFILNYSIISFLGTTYFFIFCLIFGISTPFFIKYIVNKFKL